MIRTIAALALQLSGVLSFAWAMHYQMYRIEMPERLSGNRNKFGGVWKYLTFLNMLLQFIFFTIALLSNFTKRLHGVRDLLFASAAFPIGMFVGIIFWSIWAVDRELIFPKVLDQYFPAILNHLMHTTVIPLQLGQLLLVRHRFPTRTKGFAITGVLCLGYLAWINYIYYMTGFWVYPVIKVILVDLFLATFLTLIRSRCSPLVRGSFSLHFVASWVAFSSSSETSLTR